MAGRALGIIETVGLASAIEAADAATKAANVELIGYELSRGGGYTTVKVEGDVGAVKAAVSAGVVAASAVNKVVSAHVIPRPHHDTDRMVFSRDTVGYHPAQVEEKPLQRKAKSREKPKNSAGKKTAGQRKSQEKILPRQEKEKGEQGVDKTPEKNQEIEQENGPEKDRVKNQEKSQEKNKGNE